MITTLTIDHALLSCRCTSSTGSSGFKTPGSLKS